MEAMGAPPEAIEAATTGINTTPDIQPGNLMTVQVFFAVSTQWVHAGMSGVRVGLNYPAVEARCRVMPDYQALELDEQNLIWSGLQRMEKAALEVWRSKD